MKVPLLRAKRRGATEAEGLAECCKRAHAVGAGLCAAVDGAAKVGDGEESVAPQPELPEHIELDRLPQQLHQLRKKMLDHAEALEFEKAAELRDQIKFLEEQLLRLT